MGRSLKAIRGVVRRDGLWRHGDFRRLWGAQTVSQFGSQVSQLALPLVAIIALQASAFRVALLGMMDMLPFLLFALPAGVWVDRLPRRPILIAADLGRAVALASVPIAAAAGALTIGQLYAVGFVAGTFTVFFDVAYQSYLPVLVGREALVDGNSKLELSRSGAQIGGPGLAGGLISALTAPYAVVADAVSFIGSALLLGRIRRVEPRPERVADSTMRVEILEGLRYILRDPRWRAIAMYVASFNFFTGITGALVLVYAVRHLDLTAGVLGIVFAVGNVGWLLGALFAGRISKRLGIGPTLILATIAGAPPLLLIPLAPKSLAVPFLIAAEIGVGFWIVIYNVNGISLIQALTPDRLLGRMNASRRFMVWGTIPLGSLTGGVLASVIGVRPTILAASVACCFCWIPLAFSPIRQIRELPQAVVEPVDDLMLLPLETQAADA